MELLQNLMLGFSVALSWNKILYCLVGCLLGTLIGVLPGIGPIATILAVGSYVAFVVLLKLQFQVWPTFITG